MFNDPVVDRIRTIAHQDHVHVQSTRRPDWSRPVGDDVNIEPKARRHAVDLLAYRTGIAINVDVSHLRARWLCKSATPVASTTVAVPAFP